MFVTAVPVGREISRILSRLCVYTKIRAGKYFTRAGRKFPKLLDTWRFCHVKIFSGNSVLLRRYARPQLNFLFILFRVKGEGGKANIAINYDLFRYRAEEQIDWFSVMILMKEIKLWKIDEIV